MGAAAARIFLGFLVRGLRVRVNVLAVNVDDQARRIGEQEGGVVGTVFNLQNDAGFSRLELRHPDLFQQPIIHVEGLAQQRRSQVGVEQIKKDSLGIINALGIELYVSFQANGDPCVVRGWTSDGRW